MKELQKKLIEIQAKLEVPKAQKNDFGNYKYRSCEDILSALKPLLKSTQTVLIISDEIVMFGDRVYVKATATLTDGDETISATGFAREALIRKGMDDSQLTGATSSYARKYALNGLFCIDDTKDADATNTHGKEEPAPAAPVASKKFPGKDIPNNPNPKPMTAAKFNCTAKDCGVEITDKVNSYSIDKFGQALCFNCQKKAKEIEEKQEEVN